MSSNPDPLDGQPPGEDLPQSLESEQRLARSELNPATSANRAIKCWSGLNGTPFDRGLLAELEKQIADIQGGNMGRPSDMRRRTLPSFLTAYDDH